MYCIMKNHHQTFTLSFIYFSFKANITFNAEYNYYAFYIRIRSPPGPKVYKGGNLRDSKATQR